MTSRFGDVIQKLTMEFKELTEDQFDDMFTLVDNHMDANAPFGGKMYETYSPEVDYVISMIDSGRIVTILDCDGDLYYASGYHHVNRLGYLILDKKYEFEFQAKLDDDFNE